MDRSGNRGCDTKVTPYPISFVEIIFAVVIGASILYFREFLFPPDVTSLSFWALFSAYFTAITSWFGWHKSTTNYPYTASRIGQIRSALDAVIVVTYVALLCFGSKADNAIVGETTSVRLYLWGFVVVFLLYLVTGRVRIIEHRNPKASKQPLIIIHGAVLLFGAITYTILSKVWPEFLTVAALWVFMLLPLATVVSYRWFRDWSELSWIEKKTIAVDMDGVLVEQVVPVLSKLKREMGVDLSKDDITDWECPIGSTNIKAEIERAQLEEEFVREMPLIEGAKEVLEVLSREFDIVIATGRQPCTDPWSHEWLKKHGIPYTRLVNTRASGKTLPDVDLLIDDYVGNVEEFIRNGHARRQAILFAQPWNKDISQISDLVESGKVRIAYSWRDVLDLVSLRHFVGGTFRR